MFVVEVFQIYCGLVMLRLRLKPEYLGAQRSDLMVG